MSNLLFYTFPKSDGQTKLTHTCHMARSKKILITRAGTVGAFMIQPKLCALVGGAQLGIWIRIRRHSQYLKSERLPGCGKPSSTVTVTHLDGSINFKQTIARFSAPWNMCSPILESREWRHLTLQALASGCSQAEPLCVCRAVELIFLTDTKGRPSINNTNFLIFCVFKWVRQSSILKADLATFLQLQLFFALQKNLP